MRNARSRATACAALILVTALSAYGCGGPSERQTTIQSYAYQDPALTVSKGTLITWTNLDGEFHDVVSDDGRFMSKGLRRSQTFSQRFDEAGTFGYYCTIHPSMKGTVAVQ